MGNHEPAHPEELGPKTFKEKAGNKTKIVYYQEKSKLDLI